MQQQPNEEWQAITSRIDIPVEGYDPDAIRRQRIVERRRKRRRRKMQRIACWAVLFLLAAALVTGLVFLVRHFVAASAPQAVPESISVLQPAQSSVPESVSTAPESVSESVPAEPQPVDAATAAAYVSPGTQPWNLLLANTQNPLPESYDNTITLTTPTSASAQQIDARAEAALQQMFADASAAGLPLYFRSGYRSYATQEYLFNSMQQDYQNRGYSQEEAYAMTKQLRNLPGTSEHQTGLAADIVPANNPSANLVESLENEPEIQWLHEHCAEYGFILRYPNGKTDITGTNYEPWHFRYVEDTAVATEIMQRGITLEEYLAQYYPS